MAANLESLTDKQITSIAERMNREGRSVSPVTVWSELRHGSIVDVAASLERWRDSHQPVPDDESVPECPQILSDTMLNVAQRLWNTACEQTENSLRQHLDTVKRRLDETCVERDEALTEYQRVEHKAALKDRQLRDLQATLNASAESVSRLQDELAASNALAEQSLTRVDEVTDQVSYREGWLASVVALLEDLHSAQEIACDERAKLDEDLKRVSEANEQAHREIEQLKRRYFAVVTEAKRRAAEVEHERLRAETASAQAKTFQAQLASVENELQETKSVWEADRSTIAAYVINAQVQRNEFLQITGFLNAALAYMPTLRDEKAALNEQVMQLTQALSAAYESASATRAEVSELEFQLVEHEQRHAASDAEKIQLIRDLHGATERIVLMEQLIAKGSEDYALARTEMVRLQQEANDERARASLLQDRILEHEHTHAVALKELEQEKRDHVAECDRATQLENMQADLARTNTVAHEAVTQLTEELARARERSLQLEQRLSEHDQADAQARSMDTQLTEEIRVSHERISQLEQHLAERDAESVSMQAEALQLATDLSESRSDAAKTRDSLSQVEQQLAERALSLSLTETALAKAKENADLANKQVAQLKEQMQEREARSLVEISGFKEEAQDQRERANTALAEVTQLEQKILDLEQSEAATRDAMHLQTLAVQARGAANEQELVALQRQLGNQARSHAQAYDELRAKAEQWVTYTKDLKQRLDVTNEKVMFVEARSTGEVALLRRLSAELERARPGHELVLREIQQKLIGEKISQELARKGFQYDPASAIMTKIQR